jgi:methylated-DNA-[protein]-cysteine S-methyltransferase
MITAFQKKVYALTKKVPRGKVTSYSAIAKKLGSSPRAVGQALRVNPFAPVVPCHRVVKADGTIGGFSGETCGKPIKRKVAMLRNEGVVIENGRIANKCIIR